MGNQSFSTWSIDLKETRDGVTVVPEDLRVQSPTKTVDAGKEIEDEHLAAGGDAHVHL